MTGILVFALVAVGACALLAGEHRGWAPALRYSIMTAALLRLAVIAASARYTPFDTGRWFADVADITWAHQDPLTSFDTGVWNFFPLPAYLLALVRQLPIAWIGAVKLIPLSADLGAVALVHRLAPDRNDLRALQFAVNPVSLLVTGVHGQLDPLAAVLLFAALAVRSGLGAGGLFGLAVSIKTWPAFCAAALLARWRNRPSVLAATAAVLGVQVLTMPLILRTDLAASRGIFRHAFDSGWWGWPSLLYPLLGDDRSRWDRVAHLGLPLTVAAVVAVAYRYRRADPLTITTATLLGIIVVSPSVAPQYLCWPLIGLVALGSRRARIFMILAAAHLSVVYVIGPPKTLGFLSLPVWLAAVLAMPAVTGRAEEPPAEGEAVHAHGLVAVSRPG